jgi:hypothetical protein
MSKYDDEFESEYERVAPRSKAGGKARTAPADNSWREHTVTAKTLLSANYRSVAPFSFSSRIIAADSA